MILCEIFSCQNQKVFAHFYIIPSPETGINNQTVEYRYGTRCYFPEV